jgi:hypothetical protein
LIDSIFIFTKFCSIDLDDIAVCEAKFLLEEINDDLAGSLSRLVGFIDCQDQPPVPNHVVLSF